MKRFISLMAAGLFALAANVFIVAPAQAAIYPPFDFWIVSDRYGQCATAGTFPGEAILIRDCGPDDASVARRQIWRFEPATNHLSVQISNTRRACLVDSGLGGPGISTCSSSATRDWPPSVLRPLQIGPGGSADRCLSSEVQVVGSSQRRVVFARACQAIPSIEQEFTLLPPI